MKTKIVSYLAICVLVISAGVAVAQQNSSTATELKTSETMGEIAIAEGVSFETDAEVEVLEMNDPSTFEEETKSLNLPFTPRMPSKSEVRMIYPSEFIQDIPPGDGRGWSWKNHDGYEEFLWAAHLTECTEPQHKVSGRVVDYGQHDDYYLVIWFGYPSMFYFYAFLEPPLDRVDTATYTLPPGDEYVLVYVLQYHTAEDPPGGWDWSALTIHECEPAPPKTEYYAVIAGEGYTCAYADNDAYDMYNALLSYPNWDASNMKLLVSDALGAGTKHDCTRTNIQDGIAWMASQADANDVCVFFYAGHGGYKPDVAPLDESDGYDEFICPEYGNILDDELNTWLSAISGYKLVAIDSCFSGGFIKAVDGMESRCSGLPRAEITDGFAQDFCRAPEDLCKAGFNVHTACDEDESAYGTAVLNNGVFTYYLVVGLNGLTADSNSDGDVDAMEAHQYLLPNVILYMGGLQNPQLCDLGTTDPLVWVL